MRLQGCVRGCSPVWLQGERDWLHANSVDWTLGPDCVGYVLVSYNVPSEVVVVRWPTADAAAGAAESEGAESGILFRFGNPLVARTGNPNPNPIPNPNPNPIPIPITSPNQASCGAGTCRSPTLTPTSTRTRSSPRTTWPTWCAAAP